MVKFLVKLFSKSLQGIKGGGAPFCSAQCATRSRKRPCQPKTAKRFFGGPGSQGPSGQAKERTRILPVRRGFSAPGVPCRLPGWSFLRGLPFLRRLLCPVFRHFSAGVPLSCPRLAGLAACCFCAWSACLVFFRFCEGFHACRLFARSVCCLCGFFLSIFALFCLTSSSQKSFPLSLRPRRASTFFRKESRQDSQKGFAPLNPIPAPCGRSFLLPRCWPAYAAFQAANRRLTGKRLKSPGAELSFSSVSVRRGTSVPFRQSPPFSRCWPAYAAPWAANRRLAGKRLKSQGAKLSFSSVSVRRGTPVPCGQSLPFSRCWPA